MTNDDQAEGEFETGSGNVFADLGMEDASELYARSKIGFYVLKLLTDRKRERVHASRILRCEALAREAFKTGLKCSVTFR